MGQVIDVLRAAERGGNVATPGRHPVWATEFWWHSNPPKDLPWTPNLNEQAAYIEEALYLLWRDQVDVAILFQLADNEGSSFQTGVLFADGEPKPAETAYRFPLVGDRISKSRVRVWGRAPEGGTLEVRVKRKRGGFRTVRRIDVEPESVFVRTIELRGRGRIQARLGDEQSLVWHQSG